MVSFEEVDDRVPFAQQLGESDGPIVVFHTIRVAPGDVDSFLAERAKSVEQMKTEPGFISTQIYRGISGSTSFVIHSVWESVATYRDAAIRPDIQERISRYPESMVASPHIFTKLAEHGSSSDGDSPR